MKRKEQVTRWAAVLPTLVLAAAAAALAAPPVQGDLHIDFIDVEGGQATLFVTPDRHSLLIDTGWPDHNGRDADRILTAAHKEHLTRIDAVLITHYHVDHVGGVPQLVQRIPVGMFLDHGENRETNDKITAAAASDYRGVLAAGKYHHQVLKAGDKLPVLGFDATVLSADGQVIDAPAGAAANPFCGEVEKPDTTENARSVGILMHWGQASILDLGDLTRDKEQALMCPINRIGTIDLLVVSHHGWEQSSSPELINAIAPRAAVMDNGAVKGGSTVVLQTLRDVSSHPAVWQLHYSQEGGQTGNFEPAHIANLQGSAQGPDPGFMIEATVGADGRMLLLNDRTGARQQYVSPAHGVPGSER